MPRTEEAPKDMEAQRNCLYAEIYQSAATMDVRSLERLCRRVHSIEIRIHSFKGGMYERK